jgi:hypothetical protein
MGAHVMRLTLVIAAPALASMGARAQDAGSPEAHGRPRNSRPSSPPPKVMGEYMTGMLSRIQAFNAEVTARVQAIMQRHGYKN